MDFEQSFDKWRKRASSSKPRRCIICDIRSVDCNRSFKTFPRLPGRCKQWLRVCGRKDLLKLTLKQLHLGKNVCDRHFLPSQVTSVNGSLKKSAVPCIHLTQHPLTDRELATWVELKQVGVSDVQHPSKECVRVQQAQPALKEVIVEANQAEEPLLELPPLVPIAVSGCTSLKVENSEHFSDAAHRRDASNLWHLNSKGPALTYRQEKTVLVKTKPGPNTCPSDQQNLDCPPLHFRVQNIHLIDPHTGSVLPENEPGPSPSQLRQIVCPPLIFRPQKSEGLLPVRGPTPTEPLAGSVPTETQTGPVPSKEPTSTCIPLNHAPWQKVGRLRLRGAGLGLKECKGLTGFLQEAGREDKKLATSVEIALAQRLIQMQKYVKYVQRSCNSLKKSNLELRRLSIRSFLEQKRVSEFVIQLAESDFQNKSKKPRGHRYTPFVRDLADTFYKAGGRTALKELGKLIPVPSKPSIQCRQRMQGKISTSS